ncbi:hypothetical protein [Neolewinella antarctica]|uniref:Outer membrane protein beta-barrel domain-containing protein n=1 Tax=Neolewinella antarctica TaxID=442734 RepID=A0ABX0XCG9_9BACT|nr:hypothetical protein [Neolewinella antarctica]NJC26538.1 hypothetical protein [Neolewinella antarctica]
MLHHNALIRLSTVFLLLLLTGSIYGQRDLRILLKDQFNEPAAAVEVDLLVSAQKLLYAESTSGPDGVARFLALYYGDTLYLQIDDYRFLPATITITPDVDSTTYVLDRLALELTQITVNAEKSPVEIHGDTMFFDVEAYRLGNETTLGDLINRIPDLSLSDNGDIMFEGKTIDHLFVEGKDIFGGRQRSVTDGISAADVAGIRLFKHYQGFGDVIGGFSKEVAVDVQLKGSAKARWLGTAEALVGTRGAHDLATNLSRVSDGKGFNGIVNVSTAPGSQLSTRDFLNAKSNSGGRKMFDQQEQISFTLDDLVPAPLRLAQGLQRSRALLSRVGYDQRIDARKAIRISGLINEESHDFTRFQALSSVATVGNDAAVSRVLDEEDFERRLAVGSIELNIGNISDTTRSRGGLNADFSYVRGRSRVSRTALGEATDVPLAHRVINGSGSLHGFRIYPTRGRLFSHKSEFSWQYDLDVSSLEAADVGSLPSFLGGVENVEYAARQNRAGFLHTMKYDRDRASGYLKIAGNVHQLTTRVQRDSTEAIRGEFGQLWDAALPVALANDYRFGQYLARVVLNGEALRRSVSDQTEVQFPYRALVVFKRGGSPARFAQVRALTASSMSAGLEQSSGLPASPRPFVVNNNNADPFLRSRVYTVGADYFDRDIRGTKALIIFTANRSWIKDGQQQIFMTRERGWVETSFLPLRRSVNTSVVMRGQLPLSKRLSISAGASLIHTRQPESPITQEFYRLSQQSFNVSARIKRLGNFELHFSYKADRLQQTINLGSGISNDINFNTNDWNATVRYKLENRLEISTEIGYRRTSTMGFTGGTALENYPATLELIYEFKKANLPNLIFRGNNLINYNPRRQQETDLDNLGVSNTSFMDIPGYLQFGLQKRW